jgi:hypothetical protein
MTSIACCVPFVTACDADVPRDGLPQPAMPGGIRVHATARLLGAQGGEHQLAPEIVGKERRIRHAGSEIKLGLAREDAHERE